MVLTSIQASLGRNHITNLPFVAWVESLKTKDKSKGRQLNYNGRANHMSLYHSSIKYFDCPSIFVHNSFTH